MPRNGAGQYTLPPNTAAVPNEAIQSAKFNAITSDLEAEANNQRPIHAGGTGGGTAAQARDNLGALGKEDKATQAEAEAGEDDQKFVTALRLMAMFEHFVSENGLGAELLYSDKNNTLTGLLISEREGHEQIRLVGGDGINPYMSIHGAEGPRGVFQGYDDHVALRVYKTDGGLHSLRVYSDGRIQWRGKDILTEDDKKPDRIDDFAPFPSPGTLTTVLHGYGDEPSRVEAWAVCVNDTGGYSAENKDRVLLSSNYRYHTGATAIGCSETEVFFATRSTEFSNKQANGNIVANGSPNWKLEIHSWM